ncbi:hypothetical protein K438DRAFT_1766683 [Mycena galopus ATCC 62051]|nr:hypothetical protein K438DRAFT_1766683 [Mycena galopus ATCC 62051]
MYFTKNNDQEGVQTKAILSSMNPTNDPNVAAAFKALMVKPAPPDTAWVCAEIERVNRDGLAVSNMDAHDPRRNVTNEKYILIAAGLFPELVKPAMPTHLEDLYALHAVVQRALNLGSRVIPLSPEDKDPDSDIRNDPELMGLTECSCGYKFKSHAKPVEEVA